MRHFACRKFNLLAIEEKCNKYTYRAHVFSHAHFVSMLVPACCHSCSWRIDYTHTRGSSTTWSFGHCFLPKKSTHLIAQCHTLHLAWALHLHLARALLSWHDLPHFPRIVFSVSFNPAPIYVNLSVVHKGTPIPHILRTLRWTVTHCTSTHRRSTGTICNRVHSAHTVLVVLKCRLFSHVMSHKLATMARTYDQILQAREETSRKLPFKIHPSRIQRCQTHPRQWYTEVEGQSWVLATLPAEGDLMRECHSLAQEPLRSSYSLLSRITRRMAQDELVAMKQHVSSLDVFVKIKGFIKQS